MKNKSGGERKKKKILKITIKKKENWFLSKKIKNMHK